MARQAKRPFSNPERLDGPAASTGTPGASGQPSVPFSSPQRVIGAHMQPEPAGARAAQGEASPANRGAARPGSR